MADRNGRSARPEFSRDLVLWLALRRVRGGHVRLHPPDHFTDSGRRLPEYLGLGMRELFDNGHIRTNVEHEGGNVAVEVTQSGEELFVELDQEQRLVQSKKDQPANGGSPR